MADPTPAAPAQSQAPHYDKAGQLTRAGMEAKHKAGYSVVHNGNIIPPGQPLPTQGDLAAAAGDTAEADRVRADNEATIRRLREENDRLKAVSHPTPAPAPAPAPVAPLKK